ncbi:dihydrolipoamide acetyltransferase [Parabacteroides sp. FAFU027]|uniref:dihydrolipoamide acetyltransferase n=1 Tax=Parabacteroides sp. FAFU027 TaxID=2922715 RepID=UPI001FAED70A|nr:dihydrolipoamide acetyltransferase [Parabacteroides sp. FAFU027]
MKSTKLRATPAARALAKRLGVDLFHVVGTGAKGRIHKDDVAGFNYEKKIHITPLAYRIAEVHHIDLNGVTGSGHNGKVMKEDVLNLIPDPAIKAIFDRDELYGLPAAASLKATTPSVRNEAESVPTIPAEQGDTEVIPMSMMRKVIGRRMSESYFGAPTFIQTWEVDMTEMNALRAKLMDPVKEKTGKKVTVTDLLSMAVVKTLMKHKYINSSLSADGNQIIFHNYVNLGIAVGLEEGLMVPVVKNAEKMSLSELVVAMKDLTERTLARKVLPDEQSGSTFTISNLGMYGVSHFTAIINQPNAAILSVSSTVKKPVVVNDEIVIRPMMSMSLTSDHRLIDGLGAARFMTELKALIENPITLLI